MKQQRPLFLLLICLFSTGIYAQTTQYSCEELQRRNNYPYFYCDCQDAVPFHFPLDATISDTTWFTATFNDIKQGLCAYWFSDESVTFEIYGYCTSRIPVIQMTIGGNRMKEMSIEEINERIKAAGQLGDVLTQAVNPVIRVYPNNGGTGHVYCYPYNEGPTSTCENTLKIVNRMTFVRNETEDVYLLEGKTARSRFGMRWKQEKDSAVTLFITRDSCNGEIVAGPVTLTDSMHLWLPDSLTMRTAYNSATRHPLYVHAHSAANLAGRLSFYTTLKMMRDTVDTTLCEGRYLPLGNQRYYRDTLLYDTTFVMGDTLLTTQYNLTVTPPTPQSQTLSLKQSQLPYLFEKQYYVRAFGKDTAEIRKDGECTKLYYLTVNHNITTKTETTDTTICEGKTLRLSNITYSRDTVLRDTTMRDADTRVITAYTIHFAEPELEYDTLYVEGADLVNGYFYQNEIFYDYETRTIEVKKSGQCTRRIEVTILPPKEPEQTGIEEQTADDQRRYKLLRDGQIVLIRQGEQYNMLGEKIY